MLQNTAIKIGQDVWSLGRRREEEIPEVFLGKQPLEPLSGAPRAGGTCSHSAEQNLELFRTTDGLKPAKRNWKQ